VSAAEYVCTGFWSVDVPPSPNDQLQLVGDFVEPSVNVTSNGAVPAVGVPLKDASGAEENAEMYLVRDIVELPPAFEAVSETV